MDHFGREVVTGAGRTVGCVIALSLMLAGGCAGLIALSTLGDKQKNDPWQSVRDESATVPVRSPELPRVEPIVRSVPPAVKAEQAQPDPEKLADGRLTLAKALLADRTKKAAALKRLQAIVDDFPETRAADEAKRLIDANR